MERLLDKINSPLDLKGRSLKELKQLAQELRVEVIQTVAKNGGHLASNLGVVELTLALHTVLDMPSDKILWDVGHQSYVHKLLTGRRDRFSTLRQWGGLSGFPKADESPYDLFTTGHSSTSISSALGLAKARDLQGEKFNIVSIIGDGSLTGGLAFEALNQAGQMKTNFIVILNDNEMSISANVGALSTYLSRLRMHPRIYRLKEWLEDAISHIPRLGTKAVRYLEKLEDSLTYLFIPGILFEELGFTYLGPIDGHNIGQLKVTLQDALLMKGPVLIHVTTKKGQGYLPAEENPCRFHSTSPFDPETGQTLSSKSGPTYTQIFGETLLHIGAQDARIIAITAAMPEGTGLSDFAAAYPERFMDVGIAESHAVTMAAGLARGGLKPVVAVYSTFFQRSYDQVVHDVCLQKLPVVFCLDRAGVVGEDGPTHHGVFDIALLRHLPQIAMMAPKDENELRHMLFTALCYNDGPVAIRYPRGMGEGVELEANLKPIPWGKGELLAEGEQAVIIAVGPLVYEAWKAVRKLAQKGIQCTLVNPRFVKPLDREMLLPLFRRIPRVVTVEDHVLAGGFGSAVAELLVDESLTEVRLERLGYPDQFLPHGGIHQLHTTFGLTEEGIYRAVTSMLIPTIKAKRKTQ